MYNSSATWMTEAWSTIADRQLYEVCLPGSHDSGMCTLTKHTSCSADFNTKTQAVPVSTQLQAGCRFFDVRPTLWGGMWYAGHMSKVLGAWQGAVGEQLDVILGNVGAFVRNRVSFSQNNEIVVLRFSHLLNYDSGKAPSPDQFNQLVANIKSWLGTDIIVTYPGESASMTLGTKTLADIRSRGNVVCLFDGLDHPDPAAGLFSCSWGDALVNQPPSVAAMPGNQVAALCTPSSGLRNIGVEQMQAGRIVPTLPFYLYSCPASQDVMFSVTQSLGAGPTPQVQWTEPVALPQVAAQPGILPAIAVSGNIVMVAYLSCYFGTYRTGQAGSPYAGDIPPGDGQVWVVISTNGGQSWGAPQVINDTAINGAPALAADKSGNFYLMFTATYWASKQLRIIKLNGAATGTVSYDKPYDLNESSDLSPSLAWNEEYQCLQAAFIKKGGTSVLFIGSYKNAYNQWFPNMSLGQYSPVAPSLGINAGGDQVVAFVADNSNRRPLACVRPVNVSDWSANEVIYDAKQTQTPSLLALNGTFYAFYTLAGGKIGCSVYDPNRKDSSGKVVGAWYAVIPHINYNLYDEYSDSQNYQYVMNDQVQKYKDFSNLDCGMFLLSWTCTLPGLWSINGVVSLADLAKQINPCLSPQMDTLINSGAISRQKKPNVLNIDYFDESATQVAWKINML